MFNNETASGVRNTLLVAAMGFDEDGSLPDGDIRLVAAIPEAHWPYVAAQLEYGLAQASLHASTRRAWDRAIRAACKIAGREYPVVCDELDLIVPF